jgi:hypothetical protein
MLSVALPPAYALCRAEMEVLDEPYVLVGAVHLRRLSR